MSCWKSNVMWTPPTSDNPYVRRSHKKSTDEIIDDGILWTGQDHSNSISSQNLFTWCHMGIIHGKHMDIPLKKTKISPSIFWFCAGGFLNLGQYPNNWLTLITPPQRGWGKPHRIATCDVFHRLKISGRIFGRRNSWCYLCTWYLVYIYISIICISILAYILSACSNSPTMKLGILPFTNCKLTAVGDYIPVYILPFRDVPSADVNWESLQTCNSTHSNGSASMYFKSTSIKDKAINGSAFSHQISHELKSRESWRDCHDNS